MCITGHSPHFGHHLSDMPLPVKAPGSLEKRFGGTATIASVFPAPVREPVAEQSKD